MTELSAVFLAFNYLLALIRAERSQTMPITPEIP